VFYNDCNNKVPSLIESSHMNCNRNKCSVLIIVVQKILATMLPYVTLLPDMNIYNFCMLMWSIVFQIFWFSAV